MLTAGRSVVEQMRELWGSIVTEEQAERCRRMAVGEEGLFKIGIRSVGSNGYASSGHFSFCSSVVYIQYTPLSQVKKRLGICDPGDNSYSFNRLYSGAMSARTETPKHGKRTLTLLVKSSAEGMCEALGAAYAVNCS